MTTLLLSVGGAVALAILGLLVTLNRKVNRIMAKETDLQATLDTIKTEVGQVAARLQAQADQITALQKQIADGTPVTQDQLDALATEATDIANALAPLANPPA